MRRIVSKLLSLADHVELYLSDQGIPFGSVEIAGHREHWPIGSSAFGSYLGRAHYLLTKEACAQQDIREAQKTLAAKAQFEAPVHPVFLRVGEIGGSIYLDLGNQSWQAVVIDSSGWRLEDRPVVRFQRPLGMRALPEPRRGGSIEELRRFINLANESDWPSLVAYILSALRAKGPFPVAQFLGEQGSAKTTAERILASVIDPKNCDFRGEPRSVRDLMIAASQSWLLCFDNLSVIPVWLSDALCRMSTGGGFATRQLRSDTNQIMLQAQRPVVLTGISELATRGDLLDRSIVFEMSPIVPAQRRTEQELWAEFEEVRPLILGALLDGVAGAIRELPNTALPEYPRMADFVRWGSAAEVALAWPRGSFSASYENNHDTLNSTALDASPITAPLMAMLVCHGNWQGTASHLLRALTEEAGEEAVNQRAWPRNPKVLSDLLRRLGPNLRATGIMVEFWRGADPARTRMIRLQAASSASSASSADDSFGNADAISNNPSRARSTDVDDSVPNSTAAGELFQQAVTENTALIKKAKSDGDLRAWVAGIREARSLAQLALRGVIVPRSELGSFKKRVKEMTDEELIEFVKQQAVALGSREPDGRSSGSSSGDAAAASTPTPA